MGSTHRGRFGRILLLGLGLGLLGAAWALPTAWYAGIPHNLEGVASPPVSGVTLLRICLLAEGLVAVGIGLWRRRGRPGAAAALRLPDPERWGLPGRSWVWILMATVVGAGLRWYRVDLDLWFDEITTVRYCRDNPLLHIVGGFTSTNNHLLNSVLIKWMLQEFGAAEWAVRLPAIVMGVLCVPAQYLLARVGLSRRYAFFAAVLLATSYHHIFFSQNARGYTGLLLGTTLGTVFFLKMLADTRIRYGVLYVVSMFLAVASTLYGVFAVAGHVALAPVVILALRRQGTPWSPVLRRMAVAWFVLGVLVLDLYALVIPQAIMVVRDVYASPGAGYAAFSVEFLTELIRGITAGFGTPVIVALAVAVPVALLFFLRFARRNWLFCLFLVSPLVTTGMVVVAANLLLAPRFFLWAVPVAFLFMAGTAEALHGWLSKRLEHRLRAGRWAQLVPLGVVAGPVLAAFWALGPYYSTPKQPNRLALEWLQQNRMPDDVIAGAYLAEQGLFFYGPGYGLHEDREVFSARTRDALVALEERFAGRRIWLVTTFPRAVALDRPDLFGHIQEGYREETRFPATVGDGEIVIWSR